MNRRVVKKKVEIWHDSAAESERFLRMKRSIDSDLGHVQPWRSDVFKPANQSLISFLCTDAGALSELKEGGRNEGDSASSLIFV